MGVEMRFTKWGGKRHWRYRLEPLGADRFGWWLGGRAGTPMRRGFEPPVTVPHPFVTLVPNDGLWIAHWNGESEPQTAVYVDVTTEPVLGPDAVEAADLDLDVVRLRDGRVQVLDEDEFEVHRTLYDYPPAVVAGARDTADTLVRVITAHEEPFGTVGPTWLAAFVANAGR